jgi:glucose/arabinose dehydrogenase
MLQLDYRQLIVGVGERAQEALRACHRTRFAKMNGNSPVGQEHLLKESFGRLRDVAQGNDGYWYVVTSDTDV